MVANLVWKQILKGNQAKNIPPNSGSKWFCNFMSWISVNKFDIEIQSDEDSTLDPLAVQWYSRQLNILTNCTTALRMYTTSFSPNLINWFQPMFVGMVLGWLSIKIESNNSSFLPRWTPSYQDGHHYKW
jgi:hypothetical protein